MNKILISKEIYDREITKGFVEDIANKILKELNLDNVELSITLTDNETIRNINKKWRGKDRPTDVLSFPLDVDFHIGYKYKPLGDIVISLPFAKKQAKEIGFSYKEEVLRLLIHGILHLLGYDHEKSEEEAEKMFSIQESIFSKLSQEL
ncbi:MAG: rRNA maturation RNase YbeY [Aquificota bacterium]|nr:MAG: rRNA maturation RNase YbeY [Aquificota bacterium]